MMKKNKELGFKIAKIIFVAAAVYLVMKYVFRIALPFLAALFLARLLYPLALKLEKKFGWKKEMARFAAYGIFLAVIGAAAGGLLYLCYRMGSNYLQNLDNFWESSCQIFYSCCEQLEKISGISTDDIRRTVTEETGSLTSSAMEYSKNAGWYMIGVLANIVVVFVAVFLMLNDYEKISAGFQKTQAGRYIVRMLKEIKTATGAYFRAQLCIMGIITGLCIAGLFLLQLPNAFWIGIAIGICDALPFLGTGTVFVPWALIDLLLGNYKNAVGFLVIYIICSFVRQILEPRMVGQNLGVPPLAVLMSIYIGISVYGGSGVLLGPVSGLIIYHILKSPEMNHFGRSNIGN